MADGSDAAAEREGGSKIPIVIVVGSTGVGKSKLGIDLALGLDGEIINADALQVYNGLQVTTNQVTEAESKGVKHHLIGFLNTEAEYTAQRFRNDAIPIIEDISRRGKVPIVVGGSTYYVQALVSLFLLDERPERQEDSTEAVVGADEEPRRRGASGGKPCTSGEDHAGALDRLTAVEAAGGSLHAKLAEVDPVAAARIHPNDTRKAGRYLDLYRTTGSPASTIFRAQASKHELRYRCCWVWVDAEQEALDRHLQMRILDMLGRGLLDEVQAIMALDLSSPTQPRFSVGIRQAIGVREFESYFRQGRRSSDHAEAGSDRPKEAAPDSRPALSPDLLDRVRDAARSRPRPTDCVEAGPGVVNPSSAEGVGCEGETPPDQRHSVAVALLEEAVSLYVHNTSRLARRQRRRLAGLVARGDWDLNRIDVTPVFASMYGNLIPLLVDGSSTPDPGPYGAVGVPSGGPSQSPAEIWKRWVEEPALELARAFLQDPDRISGGKLSSDCAREPRPDPWTQRVCEACGGRVLRGDHEWEAHVQGRSHRKRVASKRRREAAQQRPEAARGRSPHKHS